ncbi:Crp/Fnr family transcriptional regulator [Alicyclobacillus sp. SO9]|uniref:Crp/Fnr family transcriptional regulator n=1 Tax=Alicyclobacillus sp. SO9 TaxID=2665646 RepID=UPI0018E75EC6|nr:Crp/Fnr family transcriptional regulator [Alicyclobacillus sp. SO9]QQE80513.1 Crp/Fnr family transcriptional regulator [Alicyclobacillus sp. SO9]
MSDYHFLHNSTWVESVSFDWKPYQAYGHTLSVAKHQYVFHEGGPVEYVFVVHSGRIRLCQLSSTGEEKTILVVGSNNLFGEVSAMQQDGYITSAVASCDSQLLRIPVQTFLSLFRSNSNFSEFICQSMSHKYKILSSQVTAISYTSAQYRVAQYVLELAQSYGESFETGVRISISFTHQEMANLVGTTRVTVAQIFGRLEELHMLIKDGSYFYIPSIENFRHLLDNPKASHSHSSVIKRDAL